jgi:hypothetical protein
MMKPLWFSTGFKTGFNGPIGLADCFNKKLDLGGMQPVSAAMSWLGGMLSGLAL